MDDEVRQLQDLAKSDRAKKLLESEEWTEAWDTYMARIDAERDKAASDDAKTVLHLHMLKKAANAAKAHLEALVSNGKVAAANLQLIEQQKRWFKR